MNWLCGCHILQCDKPVNDELQFQRRKHTMIRLIHIIAPRLKPINHKVAPRAGWYWDYLDAFDDLWAWVHFNGKLCTRSTTSYKLDNFRYMLIIYEWLDITTIPSCIKSYWSYTRSTSSFSWCDNARIRIIDTICRCITLFYWQNMWHENLSCSTLSILFVMSVNRDSSSTLP
jgi:hypothetical protein